MEYVIASLAVQRNPLLALHQASFVDTRRACMVPCCVSPSSQHTEIQIDMGGGMDMFGGDGESLCTFSCASPRQMLKTAVSICLGEAAG